MNVLNVAQTDEYLVMFRANAKLILFCVCYRGAGIMERLQRDEMKSNEYVADC